MRVGLLRAVERSRKEITDELGCTEVEVRMAELRLERARERFDYGGPDD